MRRKGFAVLILVMLLALGLRLALGPRYRVSLAARPRAFATAMPATVLWAWEEPEDLRNIDPSHTGVAYLAESFTLTDRLSVRPRFQPLHVAPGTSVMAVVRIQPAAGFHDTPALRAATVEALVQQARQSGVHALQVDFDATRSQRDFYAAVLHGLRPRMPVGMPLSMTALVSWCGPADDWIAGLPVDEAVPMFFRLGGRSKPRDNKDGYVIREPLCRSSNGVSTDESWPVIDPAQRLYVFAPHPWSIAQLNVIHNASSPNSLPSELTP